MAHSPLPMTHKHTFDSPWAIDIIAESLSAGRAKYMTRTKRNARGRIDAIDRAVAESRSLLT